MGKEFISLRNLNASIGIVLISLPYSISLIYILNSYDKQFQLIPYQGLLSILLGFTLSYFYNGNGYFIRVFTASQCFILIPLVKSYGLIIIPLVNFTIFLVYLFLNYFKTYKFEMIIPNNILYSLKLLIGISLVLNDFNKAYCFLNFNELIFYLIEATFFNKFRLIFFICLSFIISIYFAKLVKNNSKIPFILILMILSTFIGFYFLKEEKYLKLKHNIDINYLEHYKNKNIFFFSILDNRIFKILDFELLFKLILTCLLFYIETIMSIKIAIYEYKKTIDIEKEILSIAITNLISSVLGLLPLNIPMGSNLIAQKIKIKNKYFLLYSIILLILINLYLWKFFKHIPIYSIHILNCTIGLLLIDINTLYNYLKYNFKIFIIIIITVFIGIINNIFSGILIGYILFIIYYLKIKTKELKIDINHLQLENYNYKDDEEDCLNQNKDNEIKDLIQKNDYKIYTFEKKFNFLFLEFHFNNFIYFKEKLILLDFNQLCKYDLEFFENYENLFNKLNTFNFEYMIIGVPIYFKNKDFLFSKVNWFVENDKFKKIIYYKEKIN